MLQATLDNGLQVILVEDHSAPVVALNIWVRVGSADERAEQWGMAHVHEHMLFKGTERRGVGEIASTVEGAGGNINAFTSYDMTVYHITMASRDAAVGFDVLADAMQSSTFDATELAKEEEVVIEEIRRSDDSPDNLLSRVLFETAYQVHPYRKEVIGTQASVRSFTREGLIDFYRSWYVPNNMTFIAVGDFEPAVALEQIKKSFANAKPRADLAHPRAAEPEQSAPRAAVVPSEFEQSLLGVGWKITAFENQDTPYLDLLGMVLGSGDSSRLYREVKDRAQLVHGIHASSYTPLDPGLFVVDAELDADKIDATVTAIAEQVRRIRDLGPSEAELERARTNLLASQVHERETMQGQAQKLGYFALLAGGLDAEARYLERVRRATQGDLQRVARAYLRPERATVVALTAKNANGSVTREQLLGALERGYGSAAAKLPHTELRDGIREYRLPNGLRVVVKRNANVPLVSLRLSFLGGLLAETESTQGITSFVAEMLSRGTASRSSAQLATEVEDIAGDLSGFSGRNSFGLQAEFLTESLDTGLDLFADVLLHPSFDPEEIAKLRVERLAALRRREDSLSTKAFELFQQTLYPDHPYRFSSIGTAQSIDKLDREALARYFTRYAQPANGVLSVVGDVDPDRVVDAIASHLSDWPGSGPVALPARKRPDVPATPREVTLEKKKAQAHLVYGFLALTISDPDLPALDVLTQILSGQGGRLFLELRDKQSLAYSVTAFDLEGVDPGIWGVYIAGEPAKLDEMKSGIERELARIVNGPIPDEEFARAKAYLIGSQAVSLQRFGTQASLLSLDDLYGLGATWHLDYDDRIAAVTVDDVKRVAKRVIRLDAPVIAVIR
ncbi:MAG: pitrilysin family protein [Myxococcota bacterium]